MATSNARFSKLTVSEKLLVLEEELAELVAIEQEVAGTWDGYMVMSDICAIKKIIEGLRSQL
jgi:hypothetical protein